MWRFFAGALAVLMLLPAVYAQEESTEKSQEATEQQAEPQTPIQQYSAMVSEHRKAVNEFMAKYRTVTDADEKRKMQFEDYPKLNADFAAKFLELYKGNADSPVGDQALTWILRYAADSEVAATAAKTVLEIVAKDLESPTALSKLVMIARTRVEPAQEAKKMLVEHFVNDEKLAPICSTLDADSQRQLIEKSTNEVVKGHAMLALGQSLLGRPVSANEEGEKLLAKVVADFGEVDYFRGGTLSARAEGPLFELNHLQIGMVAPNIEGTDVDDESFQLADYRGKVVILDFWGDW